MPPKVAQTQVVIVAIVNKGDDKAVLHAKCDEIGAALRESENLKLFLACEEVP